MPYIVKVKISNGRLGDEMAQMRTWIDHKGCAPAAFRAVSSPHCSVFHVEFSAGPEADAFASAFGGRLLTGSS